jgi:hypothetical protein
MLSILGSAYVSLEVQVWPDHIALIRSRYSQVLALHQEFLGYGDSLTVLF